jgi:NADH dehydrogenase FAD-containing subunit
LLSLNVGSEIATADFAKYTGLLLPVRPLNAFAAGWEQFLTLRDRKAEVRVVVVGAGAAGVELALAAQHALKGGTVDLVGCHHLLNGHAPSVVKRAERTLERRGVRMHRGRATGTSKGVLLESGEHLPADAIVLATGPHAPAWLARSGLDLAPDGFIAVGPTQQSTSHANIWAVGDVATRVDHPHAKSGVYATRAGYRLFVNLNHALNGGQSFHHYTPKKRSLYLMGTGPREAILSYGGWSAEGAWVWRWKESIDRKFMRSLLRGAAP